MNKLETIIFAECQLDFKYEQILKGLPLEYQIIRFGSFLKLIFKKFNENTAYYYHIRYLKNKGLLSIPLYLTVLIICKLKRIKVVWTCHNIYEHKYRFKWINNITRGIVYLGAYRVILMHKDLEQGLPHYNRNKIVFANFGNFKKSIESQNNKNSHFTNQYNAWLKSRNNKNVDIVFIGAYSKFKNIELLLSLLKKDKDLSALIIAPNLIKHSNNTLFNGSINNVFLYTDKKVSYEVANILKTKNIIGYVGHDNLSVPTSIYMFASYNIPIVGFNSPPVNSIITENELGAVFNSVESLKAAIVKVQKNYGQHKNKTNQFLDENSWEKSKKHHLTIFFE